MKRLIITGGAGFVGSNLATRFKDAFPSTEVIAFDNLKRRGSEFSLPRLKEKGVEFHHGDIRVKDDLMELGDCDLLIDCAAEPSVMAGADGSPEYVLQTNLRGTINCLEYARLKSSDFLFLSTSRVYPVAALNNLSYEEKETRFELSESQTEPGASKEGISEDFTLKGARTLYGGSKLSSEHMIEEYIDSYNLRAIVNRCGVLTGPWQMGKVDQGVVVLWAARHIFKKPLSYFGFGGTGKQVRDILHVEDLFNLLLTQIKDFDRFNGTTWNVGGGLKGSVSLQELTTLCQEYSGNALSIGGVEETRKGDVKYFVTDSNRIIKEAAWKPERDPAAIIEEVCAWIHDNKSLLEPVLG